MEELKLYSILISKLTYISSEFNKYKKMDKADKMEGYLYMISNPLHLVYNIDVYIVKCNTYEKKLGDRIIKSIKVPYMNIIYELLNIILLPHQIIKKFYTEEKIIKKEFDKIKSSFHNKDNLIGLETYINYVLLSLGKKYGSISNYVKMHNLNKIKKEKEISCVNVYNGKLLVKPINKKIFGMIKNYSSDVRKYGFILMVESEELTKYYSSQISNIMVCEKWKKVIDDLYVIEPNIISTRVYDYELAKLLIEDQLGKYKVNTNNYLCGIEKIKEVYGKVVSYYEKYDTVEKIKQAYLFEEYKIGNKVIEEKNSNNKVYIEKNNLKLLKEGKKYDPDIDNVDINDNKICMKTKTRYEMICEKLKNK